jgi:hypothetical protein
MIYLPSSPFGANDHHQPLPLLFQLRGEMPKLATPAQTPIPAIFTTPLTPLNVNI